MAPSVPLNMCTVNTHTVRMTTTAPYGLRVTFPHDNAIKKLKGVYKVQL